MARIIKNLLILIVVLVTVGCNLPTKNVVTPTIVSTITSQPTQVIPTATTPVQTNTPESPTPTILPPTVTIMPQPTEQGIQYNNVFGITTYTLDEAGGLDQVAQAGTVWTRNGFLWNAIEPSPGDRLWNPELEQGLIRTDSLGVEPIMLIEGTPRLGIESRLQLWGSG